MTGGIVITTPPYEVHMLFPWSWVIIYNPTRPPPPPDPPPEP